MGYDTQGRRSSLIFPNGDTTSYGYDVLYRLLTAAGSQGTETFTYDGVGNRLSGPTVKETPAAAYDYNNGHQMIQGRKYNYTYDPNGNQTSRILKNGKTWVQNLKGLALKSEKMAVAQEMDFLENRGIHQAGPSKMTFALSFQMG